MQHVIEFPSILSLCAYTELCLFTHPLMDIWVLAIVTNAFFNMGLQKEG